MSTPVSANLEKFRFYTSEVESPDHFIDWNYYFGVASCLERRIWMNDDYTIYPNMFIVFVADPGVGKSVPAVELKKILASLIKVKPKDNGEIEIIPLIKMSPDSLTLQSLWEFMGDITEHIKICDNPRKYYAHTSACFLLAEEMGTMFSEDTRELIPFLTQAWSCGDFHRKTKTQGEVYLKNMCVNLLGCTQPSWVKRNVKDDILEEGYGARTIWIYGDKPRKRTTIIRTTPEQKAARDEIKKHFKALLELPPTELKLSPLSTPEVWEWLDEWVKKKMDKRFNEDKKMIHYYARKKHLLLKLAIVMHYLDKLDPNLTVEDFEMALRVLETNERTMHLALSGATTNPLAILSDKILKSIDRLNGKCTEKLLIIENWESGDLEQINKALEYLKSTGQVGTRTNEEGKTIHYRNNQNEIVI